MLKVIYFRPTGILRNGDVIGYVIKYTRVGSGVSQMITVDGDDKRGEQFSFIPGLVPGTMYTIEVAALNINGTGPFSDPLNGTSGEDSE